MNKLIAVMTPTYNREKCIVNLYNSLKKQGNKGFKWLIVDDGSADNTENVVKAFIDENELEIEYIKKENGGKHTALNLAFKTIKEKYTFIVDSDDMLTEDAIQEIYDCDEIITSNNLAGVSFLRGYDAEKAIGTAFPQNGVFNGIDIQFRYKIGGDKAEVWRTDILKKFEFPIFKGERFQGENYVWWQIAMEYDMLYINKIIYITEYLPGGLSRSGKKLRISCPLGGMENSKLAFNSKFPLRERIKRAWLYICYGLFAKKSIVQIVRESGRKRLVIPNIPFGWLLYQYWKKKYV